MSTEAFIAIVMAVVFTVLIGMMLLNHKERIQRIKSLIDFVGSNKYEWTETTTTLVPVKLNRQMIRDIVSQRSSNLPDSQEGDRWAWVVQSQEGGPYRLDIDVDGLTDAIWRMVKNEFEAGSTETGQSSSGDSANDAGRGNDS